MSENSESRQHDGKASLPTLVRLTRAIDPSTVPIALRKAWVLRLPYPPGSGTMPAVQRLLKRFQADHGADVLRHVKTIRKTEDEGVPARMDAVLAYQAETGDLATEEEVVSLIKKYQPDLLGEKSAQADAEGARGPVIRALDIPTTPIPTRSRIAEWNAFWPCVLRITGPADAPISDASAQKAANSVSLTSSSTSIDFIDRARDARMWTENTARLQWAKDGFQACLRLARQAQAKGDLPIGAYVTTAVEGSNAGMEGMLPAFAHDTRISSNHPLRHAVLNIIRAVADGRAALKIRSDKLAELEQDGISNLPTQADSIPAEQFDEGVSAPAAPAAPAGNGTDYLLSSLTLFTTHEPCVFCTMALLHSRVRQVFFLLPSPGSGGCCGDRDGRSDLCEGGRGGGPLALHEQAGLNHHFEVWRWVGSWSEVGLQEGVPSEADDGEGMSLSDLRIPGINP